ncbi:hypothetical protein WJX77_010605 [Trebouxia sp. C0004]
MQRSLLHEEPSMPKTATDQDTVIGHYQQVVGLRRQQKAANVDPGPHTPTQGSGTLRFYSCRSTVIHTQVHLQQYPRETYARF